MLLPYTKDIENLKLVLCSQSKGRFEILNNLGLKFAIYPSKFEEDLDKSQFKDPRDYATATCQGKVKDVLGSINIEWDVLIFGDSIVDLDGEIIEKPYTVDDAYKMIHKLNGKTHQLHSCLIVIAKNKDGKLFEQVGVDSTQVHFAQSSEETIKAYSQNEQFWSGKSGGYTLAGQGGFLIKALTGSWSNVIGLPQYKFGEFMLNALQFLKQ